MRVRILTLNIWNEEGDAKRRLEIIRRGISELAPDLVALQEVVRSGDRDQLAALLEGTGLHGTHQAEVMATSPPWIERYGGSALATRWPHRIVEVMDLRLADAADVPWCTLAASVPIPGLGDLLFVAATASWRLEAESARERQVVALTDLDARHRGPLPTIIAGDFNASPEAASIRYLRGLQSLGGRSVHYHDAWDLAGDGPGHTWTVDNPNAKAGIDAIVRQDEHRRRLDYVFVGSWHAHPKASCRVRSAKLAFDAAVDGVWASDHFGVVVDVEIDKQER